MKKAVLLLVFGVLCICACQKEPFKDLEGVKLDVSKISTRAAGLYILNEGKMGANNASLDFLSFTDGSYKSGVFRKMNPEVGAGLGDVGNDIKVHGNEVWMVINNSGIVEVISAEDGKELAAIAVPTPRCIAFDEVYAYVTSWAGAHATYTYDENWVSTLTDYSNPKGCVYRINLKTKKIDGEPLEVGYQPEGIACYNGKLYVANSGGISSQLPPNYTYDNTVYTATVKPVDNGDGTMTLSFTIYEIDLDTFQKLDSNGLKEYYKLTPDKAAANKTINPVKTGTAKVGVGQTSYYLLSYKTVR